MELTVHRHTLTAHSTIGLLSVDGTPFCTTLEDPVRPAREKVWGDTAIPAGRYGVIVNQSTRFSEKAGHPVFLPLLVAVPGFEGVRIHSGNRPEDTEGCLLVGVYDKSHPDWINCSRDTFAKLFPLIQAAYKAQQPIHITLK